MAWTLLLPALVAVTVGLAAGRLQRQLRPALATVSFTMLAGTAAVAVVGAIVVLATLTIARFPLVADQVAWCRAITSAHGLPTAGALGVVAGTVAMFVSAATTARRHRRRPSITVNGELVVLPTDEPTAYALPGRPGQVVVSRGMLRHLDAQERRVLLAHERAHLRYRHHRYLWVADVSAAVLPILVPLRERVRFATERWADEAAATEVGDRAVVARTICRAALLQHDRTTPAMALAGLGVPDRVDALLKEQVSRREPFPTAGAAGAMVIAVTASTWQLHHMLAFAAHVCRLS